MGIKFLLKLILVICISILSATGFAQKAPSKKFVVVLDAGHGGHDSGNTKNHYLEKDIALKIVLDVGKQLEKDPDIKVIYTRKKDVFLKLRERAAIANKADADLFVSVHCNAHSSNAYGTETFVLGLHKSKANFEVAKKENEVIFLEKDYKEEYAGFDPSKPESLIGLTLMQEEYLDQSIMLATLIQNNFTHTLKRNDRSVKQAGFWVLHNTYMPSVLIETGFLSNKKEGAYLNSRKGQQAMAREIAKAIKTYKNSLTLTTNDTKNPTIEEKEIDQAINQTQENIYKDIEFKVQVAASKKKLDTKPYNFKGLKDITRIKEGGLYKYFYGSTSDYNKIQLLKKYAREKGFSSAFIVAFKNGEKQQISAILKTVN